MTQCPTSRYSLSNNTKRATIERLILMLPMTTMVGELQWADLQSAQYLYRSLSIDISRALQSTLGAKAVLFALIAQEQGCSDLTQFFAYTKHVLAQRVSQLQRALACSDNRLGFTDCGASHSSFVGIKHLKNVNFL
jgi:hypothetical protein